MSDTPQSSQAGRHPTGLAPWQQRLHEIIFEADTPSGRAFDIGLFVLIAVSVIVVMAESVVQGPEGDRISHQADWNQILRISEWLLTFVFTCEYVLRILCVRRPTKYMFSFFGIVDLMSIAPTYLSFFVTGSQSLTVIRTLRLLRVFRVLKLAPYLTEARALLLALKKTRAKITVFLVFVLILVIILGSVMYVIEGGGNSEQFTSLPKSVYWAIVTVTTVGYGDISPETPLGQAIAALSMILGYSIIVVPTGFTLVEVFSQSSISTQACPSCSREGHAIDAKFCKYCGHHL